MDLDFLEKIWQGIGNIGADTDKFMKREMPFDSGWGTPAAIAAAIAAPQLIPAMGEAGASEGMLSSLGGGEFIPTAGNSFSLDFLNPSTGMPWESTGSGLTGNGFNGYTPQEQAAKYPMDVMDAANKKSSFQQLLGKQLMSGGLKGLGGGGGSGYQHQDTPVQRQAAFAQTPAPFQVQNKDSDIAALIAALKKKDLG
jgi:hypothetical protein